MIEEYLFELLDGVDALKTKVFPLKIAQDIKEPCASYQIVNKKAIQTLGTIEGYKVDVRFEIFTKKYNELKNLESITLGVLDNSELDIDNLDTYEDYSHEDEIYRLTIDIKITI